jgi:hypothetical protein
VTTPLASSSDVIVDGYDPTQVDKALSWATSVIEGYCNRTFGLVTDDTVTVTPHHGQGLLPQYPVVSVSAVAGYMLDMSTGAYGWVPITNFWCDNDTGTLYNTTGLAGVVWTGGPSWPWLPASLRVTYTHGYDPIPSDLRDVCARLALRYLQNPGAMVERRVGDMEARFSGSAGALFDQFDLAVLNTYSNVGVA